MRMTWGGRRGETWWDLGQDTRKERGLDTVSQRWMLAPTLAGWSRSVLDGKVHSSRSGTCSFRQPRSQWSRCETFPLQLLGPGLSRAASIQSIAGMEMVQSVHDLPVRKSRPSQRVGRGSCPNTERTPRANIRRRGRGDAGSGPGRRIGVCPWPHRLAGADGRTGSVGFGNAPWPCVGRSLVLRAMRLSEVGRGRMHSRDRALGRLGAPGSANCQSKAGWRSG